MYDRIALNRKPVLNNHIYGLHIDCLAGVVGIVRGRDGDFVGVSGRVKKGASGSARRMNCNGVKGDPLVEGVDIID